MLKEMINEQRMEAFMEKRDADFSYEIPGLSRFRVNAHYQRNSVAMALRVITDKVRQLDQLGLPEVVTRLTYLPRGLVLVTGDTGSGRWIASSRSCRPGAWSSARLSAMRSS